MNKYFAQIGNVGKGEGEPLEHLEVTLSLLQHCLELGHQKAGHFSLGLAKLSAQAPLGFPCIFSLFIDNIIGMFEEMLRETTHEAVSYTHLTLPTKQVQCRSRWSPYH